MMRASVVCDSRNGLMIDKQVSALASEEVAVIVGSNVVFLLAE